jgi:hypothetical protein
VNLPGTLFWADPQTTPPVWYSLVAGLAAVLWGAPTITILFFNKPKRMVPAVYRNAPGLLEELIREVVGKPRKPKEP